MPKDNQLLNIERALGRLEGKVDGMNQRLDKINGNLESHAKKIDRLENQVAVIKGKSTMLGAIAGFLVSVIAAMVAFFRK